MNVYRAWISDDRPCGSAGAIETEKMFSERAGALKWLADWIKDDLDDNDDLDPDVAQRLLGLHESGRYEELIAEYPSHITVEWNAMPLRMGVSEQTVE